MNLFELLIKYKFKISSVIVLKFILINEINTLIKIKSI